MTIATVMMMVVGILSLITWTITKLIIRTTAAIVGASEQVNRDLKQVDNQLDEILTKIKE